MIMEEIHFNIIHKLIESIEKRKSIRLWELCGEDNSYVFEYQLQKDFEKILEEFSLTLSHK